MSLRLPLRRRRSRSLPPPSSKVEEATSYLTEWLDRNSFHCDESNKESSSVDENKIGLGPTIGPIGRIVRGADLEVYEDDADFEASANDFGGYLPRTLKDERRARPSKDEQLSSPSKECEAKRQIVSRLPWRDEKGLLGKYTGQVDSRLRPHGCGALVYLNGSTNVAYWEKGRPVKPWTPKEVDETRQKKKQKDDDETGQDQKPKEERKQRTLLKIDSSQRTLPEELGCDEKPSTPPATSKKRTFLPYLDLGDVGHPDDMLPLSSASESPSDAPPTESGVLDWMDARLKMHDFVFVLRSNGTWTYAIVAEKGAAGMRLVVDEEGRTKALSRRCWTTSVRLVDPERARCGGRAA